MGAESDHLIQTYLTEGWWFMPVHPPVKPIPLILPYAEKGKSITNVARTISSHTHAGFATMPGADMLDSLLGRGSTCDICLDCTQKQILCAMLYIETVMA